MLPFQMNYAVILSIISSLSHIIVLSVHLTVIQKDPIPRQPITNQVNSEANKDSDWVKAAGLFKYVFKL